MNEGIWIALGAAVGGVVGWLLAEGRFKSRQSDAISDAQGRAAAAESVQAELRKQTTELTARLDESQRRMENLAQDKTAATAQLEESRKSLGEQKKLLDETVERLSNTFKGLSADALKSNNQAFLDLSKKTFETIMSEAKGDLGKKQQAIDSLVKPLHESLAKYEQQIQSIEQSRQKAYGSLEEQVKSLASSQQMLQRETNQLVTALRAPQVRGRWGEITLRRAAELAGMVDRCDFVEQATLDGESGRQRPDMIVHLPAGRRIVVDAKAPMNAFLDALEQKNEDQRSEALARHARQIRDHLTQLSSKGYWRQLDMTPEFVVLFIPGESFFSAAIEQDRKILEDGVEQRVIVATPTTLIALLHAVAYGWKQEQIAQNALEVSKIGLDLYDRVRKFAELLGAVGGSLSRAVDEYNRAIGSLEARVLPGARKFRDLGIGSDQTIGELEPIDKSARDFQLPPADHDE